MSRVERTPNTDRYLLSIDPGLSTGVTLWRYSDAEAAKRIAAWQVEGGLTGFKDWLPISADGDFYGGMDLARRRSSDGKRDGRITVNHDMPWVIEPEQMDAVVEKFTPLQNKGFALTQDSVEPLRIEGALVALGIIPDPSVDADPWQRPSVMYFAGGSTLPEKKKNLRAWLKENGLHLTGKDVGCKDANDAISSTAHALVWFRRHAHRPTIERYWPDGD